MLLNGIMAALRQCVIPASKRLPHLLTSHALLPPPPPAAALPGIWTRHRSDGRRGSAPAIPFEVEYAEAERAEQAFHRRHFFQAPPPTAYKARDVYLPFWVFEATVQTDLISVDVSERRTVLGRDGKPRFETHTHTVWIGQRLEPLRYGQHEEGMQVPAGAKYHAADLRQLHPGAHVHSAAALTPGMLDSALGGARRVGAFEVAQRDAAGAAQRWLHSREQHRCAEVAEGMVTGGQSVTAVNISMTITQLLGRPLYVPAFVFSYRYSVSGLETKLRTFVAGFDERHVSGQRVLDPIKVAAATGVAVGAAAVALGSASLSAPLELVLTYVLLPALATGYAALYQPMAVILWRTESAKLKTRLRSFLTQLALSQARASGGQWTDRAGYGQQRRAERAAQQAEPGAALRPDPLGLYARLGVEPDASADEVKAAFRGMALKHHPDRFADPAEKEAAGQRFQEVSAAYQVLRNERRRAHYDATGRVDSE
mmetsp:Transcript_4201/g.10655  ORF Transcript_4201/g.10655 Transcript_4201/m.10655 type:complete len:484 (+) Transcript_4201:247-1698(+)